MSNNEELGTVHYEQPATYAPPQSVTAPQNPLLKYTRMRMPGTHVRLPTNGRFMPPGSIGFSMTGDVEVFPRRAADELLLKSPDALMNGVAIEELLKSCVPSIQNPRLVSTPDLDVILMAIHVASEGESMDFNAKCEKCEHVSEYEAHLPTMLETVKEMEIDPVVRLTPDLLIYVRPFNLENMTRVSKLSFDETRRIQMCADDQRDQVARESYLRLTQMNVSMISDCVLKVVAEGQVVVNRKDIFEFMGNIDARWTKMVEKKLKELNEFGVDKNLSVVCQNEKCKHEWTAKVEFDPANFFAPNS